MKILRFLLVSAFIAFAKAELLTKPSTSPYRHDLNEDKRNPVFFCTAPDNVLAADAQLRWFFGDALINHTYPDTAQKINKFTTVMPGGKTLKLQIIQVSVDDIGTYTCKGIVNNKEEEANIQLEVYHGIRVTSPNRQFAVEGTDARIWCRIKKSNAPKSVTWYRNNFQTIEAGEKYYWGQSTEANNVGNYLEISNIQIADGGEYICQIDITTIDPPLSLSHYINVTVTVPPKCNVPIQVAPTSPKEGDTVTLTCRAYGIPEPTYMFRKNEEDLMEERSHDGVYTIENAMRTDEGVYTCEAKNMGGVDTAEVNLNILIKPIIQNMDNITKDEYDNVRFGCSATGDPIPFVSWRKKGSNTHFLAANNDNADREVYLESTSDAAELDQNTKVYKRTTYLVFKRIKPSDAGEYVCSASNTLGEVEKTFKIEVRYKPNFADQIENRFWGWVGSKTNLTCITSGNPEPVIRWYKGDKELTDDPNYRINIEKGTNPNRAISYLTPTVTSDNVGEVFGDYKCEARNNFGVNEEDLQFHLAHVPKEPLISVVNNKPTALDLSLSPPEDDGNQPVTMYIITFGVNLKQGNVTGNITKRLGPEEKATRVRLSPLVANTKYDIEVTAVNSVGPGEKKSIFETTARLSRPDPVQIKSSRTGQHGNTYKLTWTAPLTGGSIIISYKVVVTEVKEIQIENGNWVAERLSKKSRTHNVDGNNNFFNINNLKTKTYYQVKVKAVNIIGSSEETMFIFKTGKGTVESGSEADEEMIDSAEDSGLDSKPILDSDTAAGDDKKFKGDTEDDGPAMGPGGIVGLVVVLLLVLLLAVDAAFCKTKQCGLMWTISSLVRSKEEGAAPGGKSPEEGDEAAAKLLGKEKDELRTENEAAKDTEAEPAEEAEPEAPEKKELEPEDKEEKPLSETVAEEPAKDTKPVQADTGATEPAVDTPTVQTQPATPEAGDKTDTTATA